MTILEYLKQMRRNLLNETSIDPYKTMTDYEVILHYFSAQGDGNPVGFQEIDLPVMEVLEEAKPKISPEDQRTIALEYPTFPEGESDFEEGAIILGGKRTRQEQYKMISSLYIDFGFWNIVKNDSKSISMAKGKKVRQWFRDSFENITSWQRLERKMLVDNEYHRRTKEKDKAYPGDKESLISAVKKYIGHNEIPGEPFDEEAAWDVVGKMVEEKQKENAEWKKELEALPDIPDELDTDASNQELLERMKEVEEKWAKANSNKSQKEN